MLLKDTIFTFFDTETTGDNSQKTDKPIEVALVKWSYKDGILETPKSWLVDPEMLIHPSAIAVHGLTDKDVIGQPLLSEIEPDIINYTKDTILVAHKIDFDLAMLPFLNETKETKIDSLRCAKQVFKISDLNSKQQDLRSHKMQELRYWLELYDIDTMGLQAHRAAADIIVTAHVFKKIIDKYFELTQNKESTIEDFVSFTKAPILIEKMPMGKFKGQPLISVLQEELKKSKNYFTWMDDEIKKGQMTLDPDLQFSIDYYKKQIIPSWNNSLKKF